MRRPYELLRGTMRLWYARMLTFAPTTPSPRSDTMVTAGRGDPDRVLLLGNGPLHGWGVLSHDLSAVGHLAECLRSRTGRATRVEFLGDERMTMASARAWLGHRAEDVEHDLVVIAIGMSDALRLAPVPAWTATLRALTEEILVSAAPCTRILLVELPRMQAYQMISGPLGALAQHHARRLTAALRRIAADSPHIEVVPAPEERFEEERPLGSSVAYEQWAHQLATHVAPVLDALRPLRPALPAPARPAHDWAGMGNVLAAARAPGGDAALTALTERAKERFGVALVAVNVVDGDRIWSAADTGASPRSMPKDLAYCATTLEQDAPLVVPDASLDARFSGNAFLDVVRLPFYTGVPLHSISGRAIGTFCVFDSVAHGQAFVPLTELQPLAEEAEALLHEMERAAHLAADAAVGSPVPGTAGPAASGR